MLIYNCRRKALTICLGIIIFFTLFPLFSQKPDQKPPGPPAADQPQKPSIPTVQNPADQDRESHSVMFLTGKVLMEDGTPPPESILVELICSRGVLRQDYTDGNGHFSFEIGGRPSYTLVDASVGGTPNSGMDDPLSGRFGGVRQAGLGRYDFSSCEIRAAFLAGFTSEVLRLGFRRTFESDVGTIILHRREGVRGTTVSLNTLAAPPEAKKAYEKAKQELMKEKPKHSSAEKNLRKALNLYPEFAAAWHLLGQIRLREQNWAASREAFEKSIAADPEFMSPYLALAQIELMEEHWREASSLTDKLIELDPAQSQAHYFHAVAQYNLGNLELSRKSLQVVETNGDAQRYVWTCFMLGVIESKQGKLQDSASYFRRFLKAEGIESVPETVRKQVEAQLEQWEDEGVIAALGRTGSDIRVPRKP